MTLELPLLGETGTYLGFLERALAVVGGAVLGGFLIGLLVQLGARLVTTQPRRAGCCSWFGSSAASLPAGSWPCWSSARAEAAGAGARASRARAMEPARRRRRPRRRKRRNKRRQRHGFLPKARCS